MRIRRPLTEYAFISASVSLHAIEYIMLSHRLTGLLTFNFFTVGLPYGVFIAARSISKFFHVTVFAALGLHNRLCFLARVVLPTQSEVCHDTKLTMIALLTLL